MLPVTLRVGQEQKSFMESFGNWIKQQLKIRGWRSADLAREAGISEATLSRLLNSSRQAGPNVCVAIARSFDLDPVFVFRKAGLLPLDTDQQKNNHLVDEACQLFMQLSEADRTYVVRLLHGLVITGSLSTSEPVKNDR